MVGFAVNLAWIDCNTLTFSLEKVKDMLGIFVSVLGLFITAFFVILAINAYSHIREIEACKDKAELFIEESRASINVNISNNKHHIDMMLKTYSEILYSEMGEQISFEGRKSVSKEDKLMRRNSLKIRQARMSYLFPMLDEEIRKTLLRQLGDIGDTQDITPIQNIVNNETESESLREVATLVLDVLRTKIKKEN